MRNIHPIPDTIRAPGPHIYRRDPTGDEPEQIDCAYILYFEVGRMAQSLRLSIQFFEKANLMIRHCSLLAITSTILLLANGANAITITLDFDSVSTGSTLLTTPLTTPAGLITLSTEGSASTSLFISPPGHGQGLLANDGGSGADNRVSLNFGFDVVSISFDYSGEGGGVYSRRRFSTMLVQSSTRSSTDLRVAGTAVVLMDQ